MSEELVDPQNEREYVTLGSQKIYIKYWAGYKYYECPNRWESGALCEFSSYDLKLLAEHMRQPHTFTGRNKEAPRMVRTGVLNTSGDEVVRPVDDDLEGCKFSE